MAPKRKQASKADEQAEDAGVDTVDAPKKDMSKVPGGKAGGAASGQCTAPQNSRFSNTYLS